MDYLRRMQMERPCFWVAAGGLLAGLPLVLSVADALGPFGCRSWAPSSWWSASSS